MRRTIVCTTSSLILLASSTVIAGQSCNFDIPYNVKISPEQTELKANSSDDVAQARTIIVSNGGIQVDGEALALNDEQRKTAALLHAEARRFVPQITQVAIEAVDIALISVTMVADAFFDGDVSTRDDLIKPLEQASVKVKSQLTPDHFDETRFEQVMETEFEPAIEKVVDTAVSRYSGKAISKLIGAIFSGDNEEAEDLAFRMENMGAEIEHKVEARAEALEKMADGLCQTLQRMDELEHNLLDVEGYPAGGIIRPDNNTTLTRLPKNSLSL